MKFILTSLLLFVFSITFSQPCPPSLSVTSSQASLCAGASLSLNVSGADTYTWMPGNLTGSVIVANPASSVVYTVTGTNSLLCTGTTTVGVTVFPLPSLSYSVNTPVCNPSAFYTITAMGANTYTWYNSLGNPIYYSAGLPGPILVPNTYSVRGTSILGCTASLTFSVPIGTTPTLITSASPFNLCVGQSSTLTVTGANSYTWTHSNENTSQVVVTPSAAIVFNVVGAIGSCTSGAGQAVIAYPNPTIATSASPSVFCIGGSSTLFATGAIPTIAHSFTWNPGGVITTPSSNFIASPTVTTTYTVVGTNTVSGCSGSTVRTVSVVQLPVILMSSNPSPICQGQPAVLSASGAVNYTWNPGNVISPTINITPLANSIYSIRGSNSHCVSNVTVAVNVLPNPTISVSASQSTLCNSGISTITASGANVYLWQPGAIFASAISPSLNSTTIYTVQGFDGNNCSSTTTVQVSVVPVPSISAQATPSIICVGSSATLSAIGSASVYSWNGTVGAQVISQTPSISTTYTLIGANGICSDTAFVSLIVQNTPTFQLAASQASVCSGSSLSLSASGFPTFTWMPGNAATASITLNPSVSAIYSVTGTYTNGCLRTQTVQFTTLPLPQFTIQSNPSAICSGASATLQVQSISNYTWLPQNLNSSSLVVTPSISSTYTLVSTNTLGCNSSSLLTVTVTPTPSLVLSASSLSVCAGQTATLSASGANTFTWSPLALTGASIVVNPIQNTSFTVLGKNGNCSDTASIQLIAFPLPSLSLSIPNPTVCSGATISLSGLGANTFTWQPYNLVSSSITQSFAQTSTLALIGTFTATSCQSLKQFTIPVIPTPTLLASANPSVLCSGNSTSLSANGAGSYTWYPGGVNSSSLIANPTINLTYTVLGANLSCTNSKTLSIFVNPQPTLSAVGNNPVQFCEGSSGQLSVSGANTYTWQPGNQSTSSYSTYFSGNYTVTGSSTSGCVSSLIFTAVVILNPTVHVISGDTIICHGESIALNAGGANSYTWSGNQAVNPYLVLPSQTTTFQVIGENSNGCKDTASVIVEVTECLGFNLNEITNETPIQLYPNPHQDEFVIHTDRLLEQAHWRLFSLSGELVTEGELTLTQQMVNTSELSKGIYFIEVRERNTILFYSKVVKD